MIQANELKIGNHIIFGKLPDVVCGLNNDGTYLSTSGEIFPLSDCYGIPLTEEILLKCGFDENYYHFSIGDFILRKPDFVVCDMGIRVQPKYLHQLQNLYFALTGKELTTNL